MGSEARKQIFFSGFFLDLSDLPLFCLFTISHMIHFDNAAVQLLIVNDSC